MSDAASSQKSVNGKTPQARGERASPSNSKPAQVAANQADLSPVAYAYDWLANVPTDHLSPAPPTLAWPAAPPGDAADADANAIDVLPRAAGLPWHTGLPHARQNRHWKAGLRRSTRALEAFAQSADMSQLRRADGKSLAGVAAQHLRVAEGDRFTKFPTYLFPEADEERAELLAEAMVLAVVFDDLWEAHEEEKLDGIRDDFVRRMRGGGSEDEASRTALQTLIDSTVKGFKHQDTIAGSGGQEVIDRVVDFSSHIPPRSEFKTFDEYLRYRFVDVAAPFLIAGVKFSIGSSVRIEDPKLARIIQLVGDHISLVNDLASFDKELREFKAGELRNLVNSVNLIRKLLGLPSWSAGKAFTYTMQLEVETQIRQELERLEASGTLDAEEWRFLRALLIMLAGNVFYSMIASRYGGEAARLPA